MKGKGFGGGASVDMLGNCSTHKLAIDLRQLQRRPQLTYLVAILNVVNLVRAARHHPRHFRTRGRYLPLSLVGKVCESNRAFSCQNPTTTRPTTVSGDKRTIYNSHQNNNQGLSYTANAEILYHYHSDRCFKDNIGSPRYNATSEVLFRPESLSKFQGMFPN